MIVILGKNGQVGQALTTLLGTEALAADKKDVDLLSGDFIPQLEGWVKDRPLSAVINAAAYTQVDKAEGKGRDAAFRINATAVGELAGWCKKRDVPLVHYSTDYVFDGSGDRPRREDEATAPINAYGQSKLAGENAIKAEGGRYIIFRTSWVYDAHNSNFFTTMLQLMKEKENLNVVADQIGAPTYAPHLAQATLSILPRRGRSGVSQGGGMIGSMEQAGPHPNPPPAGEGIFHLTNSGATSWHGFAQAIFALAQAYDSSIKCREINPIPTSAYPLPAPRPLNSRLDCTRAREMLGIALPSWEVGLKECSEEKYAGSGLRDKGT